MVRYRTLLLATTNVGKLRELQAVLEGLQVDVTTLAQHPDLPEPVEDADTFEENARKKALYYAVRTHGWALADDSGLEVDALGGEPGVHSARYAGPACDAAANNDKLIRALAGLPLEKRTARFRCVVALARPGEVVDIATGAVEGIIVDEPKGTNGFGYDPHFFVPEFRMTTAQMPPEQKNRISHRGKALLAIRPVIERWIACEGNGLIEQRRGNL